MSYECRVLRHQIVLSDVPFSTYTEILLQFNSLGGRGGPGVIFVDRSAVPPPEVLLIRGAAELHEARAFYALDERDRRQRRFPFKMFKHPEVRQALWELFHGKCAYCESPVGLRGMEHSVEQFRPKGGVVRPDGILLPDYYWWLAGDWENLYLVCRVCNQRSAGSGKGDRFPLEDESTRAAPLASWEHLAEEKPLLLDPCRDDPAEHLVFLAEGIVVSGTTRGQATIEILGLNRQQLIADRAERAIAVRLSLSALLGQDSSAVLDSLTSAAAAYAGSNRQILGSLLTEMGGRISDQQAERAVVVSAAKRRRDEASYRRFLGKQERFSLKDVESLERYRSVQRHIERIVIRNVKGIQSVDLDLTKSSSPTAPWTMLLGENGTGKSTTLQAVALALIGREYAEELALDPADFVRQAANVTKGSVEVFLTGSRQSRKIVFRPSGFEFIRSEEPQTIVLGYGGTRLLPVPGAPPSSSPQWARVAGLFRPATSLTDAEAWLIAANAEVFDYTAGAIRNLLELGPGPRLARALGGGRCRTGAGPAPVPQGAEHRISIRTRDSDRHTRTHIPFLAYARVGRGHRAARRDRHAPPPLMEDADRARPAPDNAEDAVHRHDARTPLPARSRRPRGRPHEARPEGTLICGNRTPLPARPAGRPVAHV